jgi:hypothetical protein
MNKKGLLIVLVLRFYAASFAQQELKLTDIAKPGDMGIAEQKAIVLAENMFGPCKVVFSGNAPGSALPVLSKEEQGKWGAKGSFDKLEIVFSGKIYSPNLGEPFLFENKTPEELGLLEIPIFPIILEQPYPLFMDLTIKAKSKPIGSALLDDAGIYRAILNVTLVKM